MLYGTISNLEFNFKFLLDLVFLNDGNYTNISKGKTIGGVDASKLVLDTTASSDFGGISGCQVWQSPYQEWVYESGVTLNVSPFISGLTLPTICSGIYINNTFFAQSGGVSGSQFLIDYINGRVIFNGAGIPSNSFVQAVYSYKDFRIDIEDPTSALEDITAYAETRLKDNPLAGNVIIYPSGDSRSTTFPCAYLEVDGPVDMAAWELGNRSQKERYLIYFYVYALNRHQLNTMKELLKDRKDYNGWVVDYNYAPLPLSGLANTVSPQYIPYQTLLENPRFNGQNVISYVMNINNVYIENVKTDTGQKSWDGAFRKAICTYDVDVYNIAPIGRIPFNPYIG